MSCTCDENECGGESWNVYLEDVANERVFRPGRDVSWGAGRAFWAAWWHSTDSGCDENLRESTEVLDGGHEVVRNKIAKECKCGLFVTIGNIEVDVEDFVSGSFRGVDRSGKSEHSDCRDCHRTWSITHDEGQRQRGVRQNVSVMCGARLSDLTDFNF
jgi:hypothetical protein